MEKTLKKGFYRNFNENFKELPFGEVVELADIVEYEGKKFGYFKDLSKIIPLDILNSVLVPEPMIVQNVLNKIEDYSYTLIAHFNSIKLRNAIIKQQKKGIEKYGHSIDECPDDKYDWEDMKYQEIADYLIYEEKQKQVKLNKQNNDEI